nr:hypothetical protein [Tanacetum cinerariifolium]
MSTTQAQQKALDDVLVAPADYLEFEKCNMILQYDIKPKEATFQVVLDALALTTLHSKHYICPEFKDLLLEHEILSFIRDLGYSGDITYLSDDLTNQAMLESKAYKTYYAFASGEKTPKLKYVRKKADSVTTPKQKPVQATKGIRLKTKAKVAKSDKKKQPEKKLKDKGLAVLSEVPDEQQQKTSGTDERTGTKPGVLDVPIYESKSKKESWSDIEEEDEDDENDSEDKSDGNDDANDDENQEGDDTNDDDEECNTPN